MANEKSPGFATNRQKLDAIQAVVNELFAFPLQSDVRNSLMYIDSVCDVPLFGAVGLGEWEK